MESLKELYKIGVGPSSSHTMGPQRAAKEILKMYPQASHFHVDLHGSLALTGKGHLTDWIIEQTFSPLSVSFSFKSDTLPEHPNGMIFHIYKDEQEIGSETVYSVGGGTIRFAGEHEKKTKDIYPHHSMKEILQYVDKQGISLYDYVLEYEDDDIVDYLYKIIDAMFASVKNGLTKEGVIQGKLQLKRVAKSMYQQEKGYF